MTGLTCEGMELYRFFNPRSVAVIGASGDPDKLGFKIFKNLVDGGFKGEMHPINVKGGEVLGREVRRSVLDVEGEIDLGIIAIPAKYVASALEECGKKSIPFAIIIAAGFREIGNMEGERELIEIARKHNIRILGPNVFGMIYTANNMNAQFGSTNIVPGKVSIITQSGALGIALMDRVFKEGIGVSAVVSVGNKADLSDEELLSYLCADENTDIILMYIEGLKDGREFIRTVRNVSKSKPIIILKSGRSKAGAKAIASHTASLAGKDKIFDAAFRQAGAIRAPTLRDAIDWTRSLSDLPLPESNQVLIITNGGGFGVLAVDMLEEYGLRLYYNFDWITRELSGILPPYASLSNPVDITAQTPPEQYIQCLEKAMDEDSIGAVIGIYGAVAGVDVKKFTEDLVRRMGRPVKPLVLCTIGGKDADTQMFDLIRAGLPAFYYPEEAVASLDVLYRYKKYRGEAEMEEPDIIKWDVERVRKIIGENRREGFNFLDLEASMKLLGTGPIDIARYEMVSDVEDAVKAAERIGYPVVIKGSSAELLHKTERGGVVTDIETEEELREEFDPVMEMSDRVMIMEQVHGREVIASAIRDRIFGPCVMFGMGGIMVEAMQDVTFRIAPIFEKEALDMMEEIKGKTVLGNFRGKKEADRNRIAHVIKALGDLMIQVPEITDIEINPLFVDENGAVSVDCRVRVE
ncbi:MAG: acetate--CoA ligase family protein [Thermoplasmatota archaeon]